MKKSAYCKRTILAILALVPALVFKAQNSKYVFTSEIIPYLYFPEQGSGDGCQVGVYRSVLGGKYKIHLTYGMNKYTYRLSGNFQISVGGVKQYIKKTDEDIFTPNIERGIEGVPDISMYENLEKAGFKHFEPHDGAFTTNYGTIEILRHHLFREKWSLDWGLGGQIGLMNLNLRAGGVLSNLHYPLSNNYLLTQVTFRISARYLYYGFTTRVMISRKVTDIFSLGFAGGTHVLMGKAKIDMIKPYLSILAKFQII